MGFKETKKDSGHTQRLTLQEIIEMSINERVLTDVEYDDVPEEAIGTTSDEGYDLVDLSGLSVLDKTVLLVHDTLNSLLVGTTVLENASELHTIIAAVDKLSTMGKTK